MLGNYLKCRIRIFVNKARQKLHAITRSILFSSELLVWEFFLLTQVYLCLFVGKVLLTGVNRSMVLFRFDWWCLESVEQVPLWVLLAQVKSYWVSWALAVQTWPRSGDVMEGECLGLTNQASCCFYESGSCKDFIRTLAALIGDCQPCPMSSPLHQWKPAKSPTVALWSHITRYCRYLSHHGIRLA